MADRYWVGGSGNWGDTAKWSTSSGGAGGATLPTSGRDVAFDANSNTGADPFTVTVNVNSKCKGLDATAVDGVMTLAGSSSLEIYGSVALPATNFEATFSGTLIFTGFTSSTTTTIDFNGNIFPSALLVFESTSSGVRWRLLSAITVGEDVTIRHNGNTLDLNGFLLTCDSLIKITTAISTITVGAGGGIVLTGKAGIFSYSSGTLTFTDPENADIYLTSTSGSRVLLGSTRALTMGNLIIGGATGTGATQINGSHTFGGISSVKTVAHTLNFIDGTTQNIGEFTARGSSGALLTIQCTTAGGYTFNLTRPDPVNTNYISVSRCTATPAESWYAGVNSTDGGDNTGWIFDQSPDNFLMFFPDAQERKP